MPKKITVPDECIAVFTCEGPSRILRQGGSQAWSLAPNRARDCSYLICVRNQRNPNHNSSDTSGAHRDVVMVCKISDVIPDPVRRGIRKKYWQIHISDYALHTVNNAWQGWQNPVKYTTLAEMGINLAELKFHPVPEK